MSDDLPSNVTPLRAPGARQARERLAKLAQLAEFEYERTRKDAGKDLRTRVDALDRIVGAARRSAGSMDGG